MTTTDSTAARARELIVAAAYELVVGGGIRGVTAEMVAARARVTEAELRQSFPTMNDLMLAVLARRERLWTFGVIEEQSRLRATEPVQQLLAIFDVFDEWFAAPDFEACVFIAVLLEMGADHPLGRAGIEHLRSIRDIVATRAERAGLRDVDDFSRSWHILMKGSIVAAAEGDRGAARRAKAMALRLIDAHTEPAPPRAGASRASDHPQ